MAALEREAEISSQHLVAWRAGLPTLANDRVVLRELRALDAASLYRVGSCPDVSRYMWPAPSRVGAFGRVTDWTWAERAAGKYVCFGVVPRGATEAAGLFELRQMQPG